MYNNTYITYLCFKSILKNSKFVNYSLILQDYTYCIAVQIEDLYCKASIPMISHERIDKLIKNYHNKYYTLRKPLSRDKDKFNFKTKLSHFVNEAKSKLFHVASCKSVINFAYSCGMKPISCSCKVVMDC